MKSDTLSAEKRKIGNDFYKANKYEQALDYYRQSLVLASSREIKALSYGNISAIFAAIFDPKSSILNIAVARKFHTRTPRPGKDIFLEKLSRREKECNDMSSAPFENAFFLGNKFPRRSFPIGLPLSYPSNPKVPGLVDRVGRTSKTFYAIKDMHFGDVVAVTKSIGSAYYQKSSIYHNNSKPTVLNKHFCSNCGITQFSVIITCDHCISRFCSDSCKETSIKGFHSFECQLLLSGDESLIKEPHFLIAVKLAYKYSSAGLKVPSTPTSCFDWTDGGKSLKDELAAINGFRNIGPLLLRPRILTIFTNKKRFLEESPQYKDIKDKDSFWRIFENLFPKIFEDVSLIYSSNDPFCIRGCNGDVANMDWLHGLFQHSCKPNVMVNRSPRLNENYYVLLEDVKAGENLSIAYLGMDYYNTSLSERKEVFGIGYDFNCTCIACQKPLFSEHTDFLRNGFKHFFSWKISEKDVNSPTKLETWFKAHLQEILTLGKDESDLKRYLFYALHFLYPRMDFIC